MKNLHNSNLPYWDVFDVMGFQPSFFGSVTPAIKVSLESIIPFASFHGTSGDDEIHGTTFQDNIYGYEGDDKLYGDSGNDYIYGGDGNDRLFGNAGSDWIYGGDGNDILRGGSDSDYLFGGTGDDKLYGNGVSAINYLYGGDGRDTLNGAPLSNDRLYFDEFDILVDGGFQSSTTSRFTGNQAHYDGGLSKGDDFDVFATIRFENLDDLYLGDSNNFIDFTALASGGNNNSFAGDENMEVYSGNGDDLYYGDDDKDYFHGSGGDDEAHGGDGDDYLTGDDGRDLLYGDGGEDTLYGGNGRDILFGGTSDDALYGGDHKDILYGDDGDDYLHGGDGVDFLYGGAGDDRFNGGNGNDRIYIDNEDTDVQGGSGFDRIYVTTDSINFTFQSHSSLTSYDIEFFYATDENDIVDFSSYDPHSYATSLTIYTKAGDDVIKTGGWDDHIYGGLGDDVMSSGSGVDIFYFFGRWGYDTITDFTIGSDTLDLRGTSTTSIGELTISQDGDDTLIEGYLKSIRLLDTDAVLIDADSFIFSGDLPAPPPEEEIHGTSGDDILFGSALNNTIYGYDGNDLIYGNGGRDTLYGGDGDDTLDASDSLYGYLYGGAGSDILIGGTSGSNRLYYDEFDSLVDGGSGGYQAIFNYGIYDGELGTDDTYVMTDPSVFQNLTQLTLSDADNTVDVSGKSFVRYQGASQNIRLSGGDGDDYFIGNAKFDHFVGNDGNDILLGQGGNDALYGGDGDDILRGGTGNDTLTDLSGTNRFYGGEGDDLINIADPDAYFKGGAGIDTINLDYNGDVSWTLTSDFDVEIIYAGSGNSIIDASLVSHSMTIFGEGGDDIISTGSGDDHVHIGQGTDMISGGTGADVFYFSSNWGRDIVTDFEDGQDILDLSATHLTFFDLAIIQRGNDAVINGGSVRHLTLLDTDASTIDENDFVFRTLTAAAESDHNVTEEMPIVEADTEQTEKSAMLAHVEKFGLASNQSFLDQNPFDEFTYDFWDFF